MNGEKVLRPGDAYLANHPLPIREAKPEVPKIEVTPEFVQAYNAMPASEVRRRYASDPAFARLVDAMLEGESDVI